MFYYPLVLKRHTGCFSTIWLVATKAIRIPRRDFLKVDVKNTCVDIMNYVLERVPPPRPGLPRPRFSLYLSSQLQYGIVVVFHRQCVILLEDLQSIVSQLVKQKTSKKIDMEDPGKPMLDIPDALLLLEETEGALDPSFGIMQDAWLSPSALIKRSEEYEREMTPPSRHEPISSAPESDLTVSPDTITLRELQPVSIPVAEFEGQELVDQHRDTLDFLMAQTDHFLEGDLELPREEREVERVRREVDRKKKKELNGSPLELQPTAPSSEDAGLMPQEDISLPPPPAEQRTPVSVPMPPSPPRPPKRRKSPAPKAKPPAEDGTRRKRRKRQLIFFDPVTQISPEDIQRQINNPEIETRRLPLPPPSPRRRHSAAELLNNPCTFLPEELQFLWKRAATVTPVAGSNLQIRERESSSESAESERERERGMEERRELEVPRHVAEPELFDISEPGSLPLEASDQREVSREISPMYTPDTERSSVARSVSALKDIPEVQDEFLERAAAEASGLQPESGEPGAPVIFKSLFPAEVSRRTVSCTFQRLLEYLSVGKLNAQQEVPFGDILIFPGPSYEEDVQLI